MNHTAPLNNLRNFLTGMGAFPRACMIESKPYAVVHQVKLWEEAPKYRILILKTANSFDFNTKQEASDFIQKHLEGQVVEWRVE